jgi:LPS O-antigen subunit length determinant protein (WzzB/FepE family)
MRNTAAPAFPYERVLEDPEATTRLELRALERMAEVLCEYVDQMSQRVKSRDSRETDLQIAVFAERRAAARQALEQRAHEPAEMRIARLQKLVEALDCSRAFFGRATQPR